MNHLLILTLLPTLALTGGVKCNDKCDLITSFTYGADPSEWKTNSLMAKVSQETKECSKESIKECGEDEACLSYAVAANAEITIKHEDDGDTTVVKSEGHMGFKINFCGPVTYTAVPPKHCKQWTSSLEKEFSSQSGGPFTVSKIEATCGEVKVCVEDCLNGAARLTAAMTLLVPTLLYLVL